PPRARSWPGCARPLAWTGWGCTTRRSSPRCWTRWNTATWMARPARSWAWCRAAGVAVGWSWRPSSTAGRAEHWTSRSVARCPRVSKPVDLEQGAAPPGAAGPAHAEQQTPTRFRRGKQLVAAFAAFTTAVCLGMVATAALNDYRIGRDQAFATAD